MYTIVPAIIPTSIKDLEMHVLKIESATRSVQIDIVDGKFVPFTSWPFLGEPDIHALAPITERFDVEVDLMIERPEETISSYVDAGIRAAVIHIESTTEVASILSLLRDRGVRIGLSLLNSTSLSELDPYIEQISYVQLMGIADIGTQGQPFDERVLERARALRAQYPAVPLSVDGGVTVDTITALRDAGITRFVSGSAIFRQNDSSAAYRALKERVASGN